MWSKNNLLLSALFSWANQRKCVWGSRGGEGRRWERVGWRPRGWLSCHFHFPQCHLSKVCGPGQRRLALLHLVPWDRAAATGEEKGGIQSVFGQVSLQCTPWLEWQEDTIQHVFLLCLAFICVQRRGFTEFQGGTSASSLHMGSQGRLWSWKEGMRQAVAFGVAQGGAGVINRAGICFNIHPSRKNQPESRCW